MTVGPTFSQLRQTDRQESCRILVMDLNKEARGLDSTYLTLTSRMVLLRKTTNITRSRMYRRTAFMIKLLMRQLLRLKEAIHGTRCYKCSRAGHKLQKEH